MNHKRFALAIKTLLDRSLAVIGLLLTLPLWFIVAIAIMLDSPGPIFFNRARVGKDGRVFVMYKFRTMYRDAEQQLKALQNRNLGGGFLIRIPDDPRVTRVGRMLRKTSLDELPQLINVLKGEMSLIGPRPQYPEEVKHYSALQRRRLEVRPGMTGLWQVSARDSADIDEWVRFDLQYIDNWSLWLDVQILFRTFTAVIVRKQVSQ